MSGRDKDDLSRFFRRASLKPEIKFNEDDWTKLEAMLDKESAKGASVGRLRKRAGLAVVALLSLVTIGTLWYLTSNGDIFSNDKTTFTKNSLQAKTSTGNVSISKENTNSNLPGTENNANEKSGSISMEPQLTRGASDKKDVDGNETEKNTVNGEHNRVGDINDIGHTNNVVSSKNSIDIKVSGKVSRAERHSELNPTIDGNQTTSLHRQNGLSGKPSGEENISGKTRMEKKAMDEKYIQPKIAGGIVEPKNQKINEQIVVPPSDITGDKIHGEHNRALSSTVATEHVLPVTSDSTNKISPEVDTAKKEATIVKADSAKEGKTAREASRWSVLLSFSPDFSSIGLKRISAPGEAIGITVNYRISSAFMIYAGLIGSHKKYQDYAEEYKPAEDHYWAKHTNGMKPDEILGSCDMLEIPIGVQYTLAHLEKSRVYAGAMLSSYIMYNESYQYSFETSNPGAATGWNARKSSTYLFSVVGFSAGYERTLTKHFAIGIAPYLKIPLSSIGSWASIKLYSLGAAVTVRYSLQKKKRLEMPILRSSSD